MTRIEVFAVLFGVLCVWFTIRQNIWCWPTGLLQVFLYIFIFYRVKLYSDLILQLLYIAMQIYGWHHWLHGGKNKHPLPVSLLTFRGRMIWFVVAVAGTAIWGFLMATFTDAAIPYGDAFTTVLSLIAQWLLTRKKLESWIFWISVDLVAIEIYWSKGLLLTSGLYAVFLFLATAGLMAWKKSLQSANE
jgi:nicotinamide mononucleotide transporter